MRGRVLDRKRSLENRQGCPTWYECDVEIRFTNRSDNVRPANVDPIAALEFAAAFFQALTVEARSAGLTLNFNGVDFRGGSIRVQSNASDPGAAAQAALLVQGHLQSVTAKPKHVSTLVKLATKHAFAKASVAEGDQVFMDFDFANVVAPPPEEPITELVEVRAQFLGMRAKNAASKSVATFVVYDGKIEVDVESPELEHLLSLNYKREVDIEVFMTHASDGKVLEGELVAVHPLSEGRDLEEWKDWFAVAGRGWAEVSSDEYEQERNEEDGLGERN